MCAFYIEAECMMQQAISPLRNDRGSDCPTAGTVASGACAACRPSPGFIHLPHVPLLSVIALILLFAMHGIASAEGQDTASGSCKPGYGSNNPSSIIGSTHPIFRGNGVILGWALDPGDPSRAITIKFYAGAEQAKGGELMGEVETSFIDWGANWKNGVQGDHGFMFRIPDRWRDGAQRTLYAQPVTCDGHIAPPLTIAEGNSFSLPASSKPHQEPLIDTHCLDPSTRCSSIGDDYSAPNFPVPNGWSDGVNYFRSWGCKSSTKIDTIERLNILPLGTFGPHFQKDSLYVNWVDLYDDGMPIVYFTSVSKDHAPRWSLKKAIFDKTEQRWKIYSVLDSPESAGGLSSQDGHGRFVIMNDYSLPGWGPASPIPGSETKVPAVSDTSVSANRPIYPLIGKGPLGLTAMTTMLYPAQASGGVEGRTCIHMNPKLLDYDAQGVPHTIIANLWQNTPRGNACRLPPGAPIAQLPAPGNYLYRYASPELGWQLDLKAGLVSDTIHQSTNNQYELTFKLLAGTGHKLILGTYDGLVEMIDIGRPKSDNTQILLDCKSSGSHFAEATGREDAFFFLATRADIATERAQYHLAPDVFLTEIYYAYAKGAHANIAR
jgi:hypothetical protein